MAAAGRRLFGGSGAGSQIEDFKSQILNSLMSRENLPHISLYPGDWRKDVGVQSLSYHYRGIWFEILMLMHCSEDRGRLVSNGKPIPNSGVARLLGLSERDAEQAVQVLLESGVASRDDNGALVNRRMVRDEANRRIWAANGAKGGRPKEGEKPKAKPKQEPKPNPTHDNDNDIGIENGFKIRIGNLFKRRVTTPWSEKELRALAALRGVQEDDVVAVEAYYSERIPPEKDFRRRDLLTLLNNWPGEVDRAKARPKPKPRFKRASKPETTTEREDPVKRAEFLKRLYAWKAAGRPLGEEVTVTL